MKLIATATLHSPTFSFDLIQKIKLKGTTTLSLYLQRLNDMVVTVPYVMIISLLRNSNQYYCKCIRYLNKDNLFKNPTMAVPREKFIFTDL